MGEGDCGRRKGHVSIHGREPEVEDGEWKSEKSIDTVTDSVPSTVTRVALPR